MASCRGGSKKHSSAETSSSDAGSVNAVTKELANLNMTGGEGFERLLECPICMEILDSPIYLCQRGHTICNTCKPKLILMKCPSCEAPVGATRNLVLESILQTLSFSCNHHHKGCNDALKYQDLGKHHEECQFRPIKCHLSDKDDCNGTLLYLSDTLSHLQSTHKLESVKSEEGHPNVFSSKSCLLSLEESDGELFHFDENAFVTLMRYDDPLTYFGFYLIGPTSDASKYSVKISIQNIIHEDVIFKSEVTTQFTSIRNFQKVLEDGDWKLPHEAIVHDDAYFRNIFSLVREVDDEPEWRTVYTINKI